jgi:hypothetical protein
MWRTFNKLFPIGLYQGKFTYDYCLITAQRKLNEHKYVNLKCGGSWWFKPESFLEVTKYSLLPTNLCSECFNLEMKMKLAIERDKYSKSTKF